MKSTEDLSAFAQFAKQSNRPTTVGKTKAVIYTRVSTKEQADNNASLKTQKKHCESYAKRKELNVVEYFGGTYESARTDERKEFTRMLSYVKRHKEIGFILVYSFDRFSRTGGSGAHIIDELKKKGVVILSATQEVDPSTAAGTMQQDVFLVFSKFDNELRRDKSITGMQDKLREGYVNGIVPFGYTNVNTGRGKVQKLIINEQGQLLKKAFEWKAKYDLTYQEITDRLKKFGWTKNYKQLSDLFRKPIYCGLITSSLIPNEVVEGKHPPLISKELFLKVNNILAKKNYGGNYTQDDVNLPLKQFVVADSCGTSYTGYLVKRKGLYYYKNNRKGSKENRSAKLMHQEFQEYLNNFQLPNEDWIAPLKEIMVSVFSELQRESLELILSLEKSMKSLENNLSTIERRFVLGELDRELYMKYKGEFETELSGIQEQIENADFSLSNLEIAVELALKKALNISKTWELGDIEEKKRIQKMIFPDGISYNHEKHHYRTNRVNALFSAIPVLTRETGGNKKGTNLNKLDLSRLVAGTGLEPMTFGL